MAEIGLGATVYYETTAGGGSYTALSNLINVTPPDATVGTTDVTNHGHTDGWRRYLPTLIEGGEAELQLEYDPESAVNATLQTIMTARTARNFKIVFSGGGNVIFSGILTKIGHETPLDDKLTKSITIKQTGAPTWATA